MKLRFLLVSAILFILSLVTGFPKTPYTYKEIKSDSGRSEIYSLDFKSLCINLAFAAMMALLATVFLVYLKNRGRELRK